MSVAVVKGFRNRILIWCASLNGGIVSEGNENCAIEILIFERISVIVRKFIIN